MHCSIWFHNLFLWHSSIRLILLAVGTLRSGDFFWAKEARFNWPTYALSNAAITGHCSLSQAIDPLLVKCFFGSDFSSAHQARRSKGFRHIQPLSTGPFLLPTWPLQPTETIYQLEFLGQTLAQPTKQDGPWVSGVISLFNRPSQSTSQNFWVRLQLSPPGLTVHGFQACKFLHYQYMVFKSNYNQVNQAPI